MDKHARVRAGTTTQSNTVLGLGVVADAGLCKPGVGGLNEHMQTKG